MKNFVEKFRRSTSSGFYLPEVDGIRFIAIFSVLFFHIFKNFIIKNNIEYNENNFLYGIFKYGGQGVQLFFVISGFILCLPFAKKYTQNQKIDLGKYFMRRLTRLEPPYILSMLLFFTILVLSHKHTFQELIDNLLASLAYLHYIIYMRGSDINSVAWTLEIEVQFYILAPFIARVFFLQPRLRRIILLLLIIGNFIINHTFDDTYYKTIVGTILGQFHYFLIGFIIADIYLHTEKKKIYNKLFLGLGLIGLILLLFINRRYSSVTELTYMFSVFIFFMAVLYSSFWKKIFSIKWIAILGGMCYSIYLLHYPITIALGSVLSNILHPNSINFLWIYLLVVTVIILLISGIFFLYIEKPCMDSKWVSKFIHRFRKQSDNIPSQNLKVLEDK